MAIIRKLPDKRRAAVGPDSRDETLADVGTRRVVFVDQSWEWSGNSRFPPPGGCSVLHNSDIYYLPGKIKPPANGELLILELTDYRNNSWKIVNEESL